MTAATLQEQPRTLRAAPAPGGIWRYGARSLGGRSNGLNLIRLLLAATVLFTHAFYLSGTGTGPMINNNNLGGWAVYGFFAVSGYLITGSRLRKSLGDYLVLRIARIFPAFLVCLVVIAFVFAPIAYHHQNGTLDGFATTPTTPLGYVLGNAGLKVVAYDVSGTLATVPFPGPWNGSLWTLYYEFLCYLLVAVLMSLAVFRRSAWPTGVALVAAVGLNVAGDRLVPYLGIAAGDLMLLIGLLPFFLAGAWLYQQRDRIAFTWPVALGAMVVGAMVGIGIDGWGKQACAPFLAYVLLWLGATIRSPKLIQVHDISYGFYIYAWPSQQLLALAGVHALGLPGSLDIIVYDLAAIVMTVILATASWLVVERPALNHARRATSRSSPRRSEEPPEPAAPTPPDVVDQAEPAREALERIPSA